MKEANKKAVGIGDLYLKSKEGVTKMDEEVDDFKAKLRKKGEGVSEAKKALNEKCIEECSTGLFDILFDQISIIIILNNLMILSNYYHYSLNHNHKPKYKLNLAILKPWSNVPNISPNNVQN